MRQRGAARNSQFYTEAANLDANEKKKSRRSYLHYQQSIPVEKERKSWMHYFLVFLCVGIFHQIDRYLLYTLFENSKHFSHLSTLEREMNYRTEMGLYYSYFKSMVNANSMMDGISSMTRDNLTEYPTTINSLQRFNLLPEILVGMQFRMYKGFCKMFGCEPTTCWKVDRGKKLPPVWSCEGPDEPIYFYTNYAFELNSFLLPITFLVCYLATDGNMEAAIVGALAFMYNFGEGTRIMWTPPLRETWAFPLIHLHLLIVTYMLKNTNVQSMPLPSTLYVNGRLETVGNNVNQSSSWSSLMCQLGVLVTTFLSLASWQFCHFNFSIFIIAMTSLYALQLIDKSQLISFLIPTTMSFFCLLVLMYENKMMITSIMATTIASAWILIFFQTQHSNSPFVNSIQYKILAPFGVVFNSFILKSMITNLLKISDEMHILNILKSKFTDFRDFHTSLYVCAREFDFIGWTYVKATGSTFLLPSAVFAGSCVLISLLLHLFSPLVKNKNSCDVLITKIFTLESKVLLQFLLSVGYGTMAVLVMRLKVFFTPHLCIMAALSLPQMATLLSHCTVWAGKPENKVKLSFAVSAVMVAIMSYHGHTNITNALNRHGEYTDPELEFLLEWIKKHTKPDDSFAGSMSTMATIKLTTNRPIVNHPHYEDANARERNKLVYTAFSRLPVEEIYNNMVKLHVKYLLLEIGWCWGKRRVGCSIAEAFDHEYPQFKHKEPTCIHLAENDPKPFVKVFENENFVLLQV